MRIDLIDTLFSSLASGPVRLLIAWLVSSSAVLFTFLIGFPAKEVFESTHWFFILYPAYLITAIVASGWMFILIIPVLMILVYRVFRFLVNDNQGSDLIAIFTLNYLVCFSMVRPHWIIGTILGIAFLALSIWADKRERSHDSFVV